MRLDINRLTLTQGDPQSLVKCLEALPHSMGSLPNERVAKEIEAYVQDQSADLSIDTVEWVRQNRKYFKDQMEIDYYERTGEWPKN